MDVSLKVIVVGNGMVGKTSMITRFARGIMTENYKKTIGTDFMEKEIVVRSSGESIKLMLWDTAGQEMFSELTRNYYRGAGAVVYVFSTTDRESFLEVERWRSKVVAECGQICEVLVQNKVDLLEKAQMTAQEVEDLARRMGIKLYRTCVKDNVLVDDVFDYLADSFLRGGGAAGVGVEAVQSIGELTAQPRPAASSSPSASPVATTASSSSSSSSAAPTATSSPRNGGGNQASAASAGGASSSSNHQGAKSSQSQSFQLTPLTVRTGGKKRTMCTIL